MPAKLAASRGSIARAIAGALMHNRHKLISSNIVRIAKDISRGGLSGLVSFIVIVLPAHCAWRVVAAAATIGSWPDVQTDLPWSYRWRGWPGNWWGRRG